MNTQTDLFDRFTEPLSAPAPQARARREDPESSHEAARTANENGSVSRHCDEILALLKLRPVTSRELAAIALKYTSRISDLRKLGHKIDCKKSVDHKTNKSCFVYFLSEED